MAAIQAETPETPETSSDYSSRKQTAETLDTMPETAGRRKHINHSGNVGNAIPGSVNQQKPSDHDRLETSDTSCHNFQTISKSCTVNFQTGRKIEKRYIMCAACESRNRFQKERQAERRKRPNRKSFQKSATILIFCGRGFANR